MKKSLFFLQFLICIQGHANTCDDLLQQIKKDGVFFKKAKVYDCSSHLSGTGDFYNSAIQACVLDIYYKDQPDDIFDLRYRSSIYMVNKKITFNGRTFKAETGDYYTNIQKNQIKSFPTNFELGRDDISSEFYNNGTSRLTVSMDGEFHMKATFDRTHLNFWYEIWEDSWFSSPQHLNFKSNCK